MANINSTYLGIPISSPIVIGSSGLSSSVDKIVELANSGAGAIVLKSIFEEEILMDYEKNATSEIGQFQNNLEFFDYYDYEIKKGVLDNINELIRSAHKQTQIPLIASINCMGNNKWVDYALKLQEAGASAIELNLYKLPFDMAHESSEIEQMYIDIIQKLVERLSIPISVKISAHFTNLGAFIFRLSRTGIKGIVLFNRFYPVDIDIEQEAITVGNIYSSQHDYTTTLRWISILSGKAECELIASTGVHRYQEIIKMLLAGANAVQVVSEIYQNGAQVIQDMNEEISQWMNRKSYESISDFRSNLSQSIAENPEVFERIQFMKYFSDHK